MVLVLFWIHENIVNTKHSSVIENCQICTILILSPRDTERDGRHTEHIIHGLTVDRFMNNFGHTTLNNVERETVPLLTSDMGKKALSILAH